MNFYPRYKTIKLSLLSAILLGNGMALAQQHEVCGVTDPMPFLQRSGEHQKTIAQNSVQSRSSLTKYVPVTFILVADDNGNGRAVEEQGLAQLAKLNEYYADQDMIYYIDEWRYKDNTLVYTDPHHPTSRFQMQLVKDNNAMNVYVTQQIEEDGQGGIVAGVYVPSNDWVIIRKDRFNGLNYVLAHEAGHFWSLPHTFSGWDCEPYDEEVHGNPVTLIWSPCNGSLRIELADGSNCQISGDQICDTKPDYNFGYGWSVGGDQCAPYTPQIMDSNGDLLDVIENNFMGYFFECDTYFFSNTQKTLIQTDFLSTPRSYLRTGRVPDQEPVDNAVVYNYPIEGEETPTFDNVDLDWENHPGATDYLVMVDRSPTFSFSPMRFLVTESFLTLPDLLPNANYYWRVWPFNESKTGAGWAATQNFHTGLASAVETISSIEYLEVFPNPVVSSDELIVRLQSEKAFEAEIALFDLTGREIIAPFVQDVQSGKEVTIPVIIEGALPGLYFLQVRSSEGGIVTRKVSIQ